MKTIDHGALHGIATRMLRASGCAAAEADTVASHLIDANLAGHDSHGIGLLASYCHRVEQGRVVPNQTPEIVQSSDTMAVWDAREGFGQVIARDAMTWAIAAAQAHGVAVHGLRNSHHIGRVGTYGEMVARAGLVSVHFVNAIGGHPPVAPFGGREGRFQTNPICIAIPGTATTQPIILDFATSRIAMGKVRVAHNMGKPVIDGALIDSDGDATTDPGVMYHEPRGAALPFGQHKGSGLALICDILAGAIVGSGTLHHGNPPERGTINGMLTIVIDPTRLSNRAFIEDEIDGMVAWAKSSPPIDPDHPVLIAGEPERIARAKRLVQGIDIDDTTWAELCEAAQKLQVAVA